MLINELLRSIENGHCYLLFLDGFSRVEVKGFNKNSPAAQLVNQSETDIPCIVKLNVQGHLLI
jgi:hypothetical protein